MSKILIIEDDPQQLHLYATAFQNRGFEVGQAASGPEGITKALYDQPEAILLDLVMPDMSGFEVMKELKLKHKDGGIPDVPIIVITNLTRKNLQEDVLKMGAAAILFKAESVPSQIVEAVKNILNKK